MEPNKIKDEEDHSDPGVQKICNFLRAPVAAKNEANQMILLMNHIEYLEIAVKKEFGELSDAILQKPLPSIKEPEREPGMSKVFYKKLMNAAIDEIQERKKNLPKALGFVMSTIDSSFGIYVKANKSPEKAFQENDIAKIMKHLEIWYSQKMGSCAKSTLLSNLDEKEKAEKNWTKLHQKKDQSIEDFYKLFLSNLKVYSNKLGITMSDQEKAFKFITKLNKSLYGEWVNKMSKEEKKFTIKKSLDPRAKKDNMNGYPTTLEEAYQLAVIEEISTIYSDSEDNDNASDKEESREHESSLGQSSYAGVRSSKKQKENSTNNGNVVKKKWPPGTKPSQIGYKLCNNPCHKDGEDRDHMKWECPYPKPRLDKTDTDGSNKNQPPTFLNPASLATIDYEKLAQHLAPLILKQGQQSQPVAYSSYRVSQKYDN